MARETKREREFIKWHEGIITSKRMLLKIKTN